MTQKKFWREKLQPYTVKSDGIALRQLVLTLLMYLGLWYLYIQTLEVSNWLVIPFIIIMPFFTLRFFVLMHDCGHGSMFSTPRANKLAGFFFGVLTGMPQYVWSKHHAYHHTTNGNWEKYKGPLSTISTEEFEQLSKREQRRYYMFRHPLAFVLLGGFIYVLFNPRFNWMVGTLKLGFDIFKTALLKSPAQAWKLAKECPSKKWKTPKEFRHMTYNNLALLSLWFFMCKWIGVYEFFILYATSISLAGGLGILFFTVQHNFEDSYAADDAHADYFKAALEGTSYLKLPALLNWFTADIAYHHIHHLSTSVPNYQLARCHQNLREHFSQVKRVSFGDIPKSVRCLLWDKKKEAIVSIDNYDIGTFSFLLTWTPQKSLAMVYGAYLLLI